MTLNPIYIDNLIKTALLEDINYIDAATDCLIAPQQKSTAKFVAKQSGILCGIDVCARVFELLDSTISFKKFFSDGQQVKNGDCIAEVSDATASILKGERTALNLLQHMSGIATKTNGLVKIMQEASPNRRCALCDTRKTLPGLRPLQKYAVTVGGGKNHRFNLSDGAMIKDNHIAASDGIENAVAALRAKLGHMTKIEVEVKNFDELQQAINSGADIIMLDNMQPSEMKKAAEITNGRALLEASGNITEQNIAEVAKSGVDIISSGALTHSVAAFDISLKFD